MVETSKERPPILVASFSQQSDVQTALQELHTLGIGLDFIGIKFGAEEMNGNNPRPREVHLLSVLAPRRLAEGARSVLQRCGALAVDEHVRLGNPNGHVPHPGTLEDRDMKLPLGLEYPDTKLRRKAAES